MCPYKTFIETEDKDLYPCHICINLKEEKGQYSRIVGEKYFEISDDEGEVERIYTNRGREILTCPYTDDDIKSTICLHRAVLNLANTVTKDMDFQQKMTRLWQHVQIKRTY